MVLGALVLSGFGGYRPGYKAAADECGDFYYFEAGRDAQNRIDLGIVPEGVGAEQFPRDVPQASS